MATDLLATRIRIPPLAAHVVPRRRLSGAIEAGIPFARLVLVSAAAGYGKTTLIAGWARSSAYPVAWLTADATDNDPDRFLRSVLRAWETVWPGVRETAFGMLLESAGPDRDRALAALVDAATGYQDHLILVIDDAHMVTAPEVLDIVELLLDHSPPTLHLVLGTRTEPPLALARRRARGELLEFHARDLAFDLPETLEFFRNGMGLDLVDDAHALVDQMEGWAAGLQLAALKLRQNPALVASAVAAGNQRDIVDFLTEEVIDPLPEDQRNFLLRTSILDRFNASLCEAVTGHDRSQEMLEALERSNLFLQPLDESRIWFRYHRLFAGVLRRSLPGDGEDAGTIHRRAAQWHLEHDLPEEAYRHALEAHDIDLVCQVLDLYLVPKLFGGDIRVVAGWLDALPPGWQAQRPEIVLARTAFLIQTGQPDAAIDLLATLEHLPGQDRPRVRQSAARAEAMRCFVACHRNNLPDAITHSERALRELPADDLVFRADLHHALGDTFRGNQLWDDARANYRRVIEIVARTSDLSKVRAITVHTHGALADLELRQGHLRAATANWTRALEIVTDRASQDRYALPVTGWIHLRLGELAYERNDLDLAHEYLDQGLARADLGGEPRAMIAGRAIAARLAMTRGELDAAATLLEEATSLLETSSFPDWAGRLTRHRVDLWLVQGRRHAAHEWATGTLDAASPAGANPDDDVLLAVARVLIETTSPGSLDQVHALLDTVIARAGELGLDGVHIEALALRAILMDRVGNVAGMLTDLETALRLAAGEGYVRRIVDLGYPILRLLREARRRDVMPGYVAILLETFAGDEQPLAGTLSSRELEVLQLLASGLSNREIAGLLFVSPETVKKHTGSIYGKLGVRGRVEAVSRGRTLSLID